MSKTFKALQRAARERAARKQEPEAKPMIESGETEPELPPTASSQAEVPPPPREVFTPASLSEMDLEEPVGEADAGLQDILKEAFVGGGELVRVESDGWVRGRLEPETARALLRKYALLHCLQQDESNSFWFWSSNREARARAEQARLSLDFEETEAD